MCLSSLSGIGKSLYIRSNSGLANINGLASVTGIGGALLISGNPALTNVDGLSALVQIGAYFEINGNPALKNVDGLSSLTGVGGGLAIFDNSGLTNLGGLSSLTSIGGRIEIADNTQLTDISGMRSIPSNAIKNLAIYRNPLLSVCNLPNICAYLAGSGLRTIQGNRDECVSAEAIIAACDPVVPTLATGTVTSPATCGGKGSIAFTTEGLPDGDYTLNFKKDGDELQATVKVEGGKITLPGTAGVYTDFSLMYNGGSANNNSSVTLSDPTPPTLSVTAVTPPTTCSGAGSTGSISFSTTGLPDGTYNLYYNINSIISSTPVQISSGAFTLSGLTPRTLYDDFHIEYNQCIGGVPAPTYMQSPPYPEFSIETVVQPQACGGLGSIIFRTNLPDGTYPFIYRTPKGGDVPVSITAVNGTFSLSNLPADTYYLFSLNHCGEYTLNVAITLLVPATPSLSAGAATDPVTCGGTGSIDFTTAHIPDGPYTLNYTFNGSNTSANINISANTFTLGDLTAGIYAAFSVTHDDCVTEDNSSVTLSDPTPVEISVHRVYDPTVCGKEDGQINFDGYNANVDLISFTFYFKVFRKKPFRLNTRLLCGLSKIVK